MSPRPRNGELLARLDERVLQIFEAINRIENKLDTHIKEYCKNKDDVEKRFVPLENFQRNAQGTIVKLVVPILLLLVGQILNGVFKWF